MRVTNTATNAATNTEGFTLVELLLVLVIVGILVSLGSGPYLEAQRRAHLREAAVQFAADLQRARGAAQRHSQDASVTLDADASSYTLTLGGVVAARRLPHGARVEVERGSGVVSYTAPYGEVNSALNKRFVISSARTDAVRYVKVIGVTGKVIVSDF